MLTGTPFPKSEPRPKKVVTPIPKVSAKRKEQIEKGLFVLKVGKPLKRITAKQAKHEREKSEAYRQRSADARPFCQGCGRYDVPLSNSHRIGQADKTHVANAENMDTYCLETCHQAYECGRLYLLDNGNEVFNWLAKTDWERYSSRVFKMIDRINDDNLSLVDLPKWVEHHVNAVTK